MDIGIVKWFNNTKGFGFIAEEGSNDDIFVHYSVIEMDGYQSLRAGQKVHFKAIRSDKGAQATKLVPIVESEAQNNDVFDA